MKTDLTGELDVNATREMLSPLMAACGRYHLRAFRDFEVAFTWLTSEQLSGEAPAEASQPF